MTDRTALRTACAGDDLANAQGVLAAFLDANPGTAAGQFAANQAKRMAARLGLPESRIAILSSFTIHPLAPHLAAAEFLAGRRLAFLSVPYEQWHGALAGPGPLDDFAPTLAILLLHLEDAAPLLARRHLAAAAELDGEVERLVEAIAEAVAAFRHRSPAPLALSTFIAAERGVERYFDRREEPSRQGRIDALNARVGAIARAHPNLYVLDYAETVADHGRNAWFDPAKGHHVGTALSAAALPHFAAEVSGFLSALERPRRKVLAVDFDDTLWGGVVGEEGADGIAVAGDYPGNAFNDFQAFLANLRASGVALAALSKNNLADAEEVFATHTRMPLGWDDFAARRIDWNDKPANLRAVAAELALGSDSMVFADNSAMECDLMRAFAPEAGVVQLDGAPSLFPRAVLAPGWFYAAALTEEDRGRAASYAAERARGSAAESTDTSGFLAALGLELTLRPPREGEIERVAQLFGKTNQFNLTTRRHSVADVLAMGAAPGTRLRIARLADRYGDYGLVGVTVTVPREPGAWEIESFLMSCRILGRGVEGALLADIDEAARAAGIRRLIGRYLPTAKNGMVARFYPDRGFEAAAGEEGAFARDLSSAPPLAFPAHTTIIKETERR